MDYDYLVNFPGLGIENLKISRVAFSVFGVDVYWYGLIIAIAAFLSLFLATRQAKKFNIDEDFVLDNFLVILITMIIGARLYYVIFSWDLYKDNPIKIFDIREGGLAFYGGVIGAILGILIFHKIKKRHVEPFLDFIVVYVPLAQGIGRIGNFINQEAFGTNTTLPWGMISNGTTAYLNAYPELGQNPNLPVHPTFLYELIGNLILFFILLQVRKRTKIPFGTVASYCLGYGLIRFFVEGIRTDSLYIGSTGIRASQLLSLLIAIGAVLYLFLMRHKKKQAVRMEEDKLFESAGIDTKSEDEDQ
jgi:phosphatidylglycerol:prolipoprotein diacylglycerol transferase